MMVMDDGDYNDADDDYNDKAVVRPKNYIICQNNTSIILVIRCGRRMIRSTFSKDQSIGSLTQTGDKYHHLNSIIETIAVITIMVGISIIINFMIVFIAIMSDCLSSLILIKIIVMMIFRSPPVDSSYPRPISNWEVTCHCHCHNNNNNHN